MTEHKGDTYTNNAADNEMKANARQILDGYMTMTNHRRTPERYAILDAVYSMEGHFTLEQINEYLEKTQFRVSRATLYNTMKMLLELRLVMKHHIGEDTTYEATQTKRGHCHQVCTICGNVTEIDTPEIAAVIDSMKLKRFRKDSFALYLYGVCSTCQAKQTRLRKTAK